MLSRGGWLRVIFLLVVAALALGLYELFDLRMEGGDIYPPYSTLRADPLGAKAFCEALRELPGFHVERNYRPLPKLQPAGPVTLLYLGLTSTARWEPGELEAFNEIVQGGGRAVFAFLPERPKSARPTPAPKTTSRKTSPTAKVSPVPKATPAPSEPKKSGPAKEDEEDERTASKSRQVWDVAQDWGVDFETMTEKKKGDFESRAVREQGVAGVEDTLPWHSALYFVGLNPEWEALYRAEGKPVVVERKMGKGTIVLLSDSFALSNEAVHSSARAPQFLSWLIGPNRTVIFDEEHHGIRENPGVATLLLKYQLHWLLLALGLLAGLFLWQQGVPFVPPASDAAPEDASVTGRSSGEGLRTLLRRGVPPGKLIETCVAEWRHAADRRELARIDDTVAQFEAVPPRERSPVAMYRALVAALRHERGRGAKPASPVRP